MSFKIFVFPEDVESAERVQQLDGEGAVLYQRGVQCSKETFIQRLGNGCLYAEEFLSDAFKQIRDVLEDEGKNTVEKIVEVKAIVDVAQAAVDKADERQVHFEEVLQKITSGNLVIRKESDYE